MQNSYKTFTKTKVMGLFIQASTEIQNQKNLNIAPPKLLLIDFKSTLIVSFCNITAKANNHHSWSCSSSCLLAKKIIDGYSKGHKMHPVLQNTFGTCEKQKPQKVKKWCVEFSYHKAAIKKVNLLVVGA